MPTLRELENNLDYQRLGFTHQQQVRRDWLQDNLLQSEEFLSLPSASRQAILGNVLDRPPVVAPNERTTITDTYLDFASRLKAGEGLEGDPTQLTGTVLRTIGLENTYSQLGIIKKLGSFAEDLVQRVTGKPKLSELGFAHTEKEKAALAYMTRELYKRDPRKVNIATGAGAIGGFALNFATGRALMAPLFGTIAGVEGTAATGAAQATSKAFRLLTKSIIPETIRNATDASVGAMDELIRMELSEEILNTQPVKETVSRMMDTFTEYFAGDMIFFGALNLAKVGGKGLFKVFGKGFGTRDIEKAGKDALDALIHGLAGGDVPEEALQQMSIVQRKAFLRELKRWEAVRKLPDVTPDEFIDSIALGRGFRSEVSPKGFKIFDQLGDKEKLIGTYSDTSLAMDGMFNYRVGQAVDFAPTKATLIGPEVNIKYKEVQTGRVFPDDAKKVISYNDWHKSTRPDVDGSLSTSRITGLVNDFYRKLDSTTPGELSIKVIKRDEYFKAGRVRNPNVLEIPSKISTPGEERLFNRKFMRDLSFGASEFTGKKTSALNQASRFMQEVGESAKKASYSPSFLKYAVRKLDPQGKIFFQTDGSVKILTSGGELEYKSMNQASADIYNRLVSADPTEAIRGIYNDKGLTTKFNETSQRYILWDFQGKDKGIVRSAQGYEDITKLLDENPDLRPKLPVTLEPEYTFVNPTTNTIEIGTNSVSGRIDRVQGFMRDNFTNHKKQLDSKMISQKGGESIFFQPQEKAFILEIPEYNFSKRFETLVEAEEYLKSGVRSWNDISDLAYDKGGRIFLQNGEFVLQKYGTDTLMHYTTREALEKGLRDLPMDPIFSKELSGATEEIVDHLGGPDTTFSSVGGKSLSQDADFLSHIYKGKTKIIDPEVEHLSIGTTWGQLWRPTTDIIQDVDRQLGGIGLTEKTLEFRRAHDKLRGDENYFIRIVNRALKSVGRKDEDILGQILAQGRGEAIWKEAAEKMNFTLKETHIEALKSISNIYDSLGQRFHIDPWKLLHGYMPAAEKYFRGGGKKVDNDALRQMEHMFKGSSGDRNVQWFAHKLKTKDLLNQSRIFNIRETLLRYGRKGYQNVHLEPEYNKIMKYLGDNPDKLPEEIVGRMGLYFTEFMGLDRDINKIIMVKGTEKVFETMMKSLQKKGLLKKFNPTDVAAGKDLIDMLHKSMIGSTMTLRPWLPLRNMHQPLLTLAPRFGMQRVWEAMKFVVNDTGEYADKLRRAGRTMMDPMGLQLQGQGFWDRAMRFGMKNYKNSDEFTRLLGARLADDMIDESLDLYKAGKLNADQFLKASGLRYIEPGVQRKVLGEIQAGNIESAKGFYQQEIIREGFFDYHKAEHPLSFKNNVIGRLFGRFGTYPVNFLENVKRGWRNAPSFGEKLAYGATFVGIHGALYGAYKEVFGVDAKNFLFWQSSSFSGGPYYNILNDSLKAIGGGPDAAQARGRALRNAKWFMVPGGTQIKSLNKAFKRYDEGDMHGFWLNLFSMPEDEEFDGPFWTR